MVITLIGEYALTAMTIVIRFNKNLTKVTLSQ